MACKARDDLATQYVVALADLRRAAAKPSDEERLLGDIRRDLLEHDIFCGCARHEDGASAWRLLLELL